MCLSPTVAEGHHSLSLCVENVTAKGWPLGGGGRPMNENSECEWGRLHIKLLMSWLYLQRGWVHMSVKCSTEDMDIYHASAQLWPLLSGTMEIVGGSAALSGHSCHLRCTKLGEEIQSRNIFVNPALKHYLWCSLTTIKLSYMGVQEKKGAGPNAINAPLAIQKSGWSF